MRGYNNAVRIELAGQTVIVTGAGRGIGKGIAQKAAEAGANVVLAARSAEQIEAVARELNERGLKALAVPTDVTQPEATKNLVQQTLQSFGRVDVLVNNAASNYVANLVMSKEEDWRRVYDVNVFAVMRLTKEVVRHLIKQKSGRVINVSSISAKTGAAYNSTYASSKAAMLGFTKSVAKEVAQLGITVNAICPWHVETELLLEAMGKRGALFGKSGADYLKDIADTSPQKRILEIDEVAGLALYLMSHEARGITGQSLNVCGGMLMD